MNEQMQECIENCLACHRECTGMVLHCLEKGGAHADPTHIRLLLDCAQICQTSADFMLRNSPLHGRTCGVCAEVCEECARDCRKLSDDSHMTMCAETCQRCAQTCRRMAAMMEA